MDTGSVTKIKTSIAKKSRGVDPWYIYMYICCRFDKDVSLVEGIRKERIIEMPLHLNGGMWHRWREGGGLGRWPQQKKRGIFGLRKGLTYKLQV